MSARARIAREEHGFTLVEVLAATVILILGVLGTLSMIDFANGKTAANQNRAVANNLARQIQETARQLPYAAVSSGGIASALQNFQLPDGTKPLADTQPLAPGWQIDMRIRPSDAQSAVQTFEVTATVCSFDDSKDGYGASPHDPSITWCNSNTGGTPVDPQPEDYKRLTVQITPPAGSGLSKPITMSTVVGNNRQSGSSSSGSSTQGRAILQTPPCTGCNASAWNLHEEVAPCFHFTTTVGTDNCAPTYNGAAGTNYSGNSITSIPVKTIWDTTPASVKFYLVEYAAVYPTAAFRETLLGNGTVDSTDPTIYTYTWNLANTYPNQTSDGGYAIKAIAYDGAGAQIGQPQQLNMWLNRFTPDLSIMGKPIAYRDKLFGASPGYPEVEWLPFKTGGRIDYDFNLFKIYRNGTLICSVGTSVYWGLALQDITYVAPNFAHQGATSRCQDTAAPASGSVTYTVGVQNWSPDGQMATSEGGNVQTSTNVNSGTNNQPNSPSAFSASWIRDPQNAWIVRFTWTKPTGTTGDPDSGDCVMSYRIYRAASTGATAPTFTQTAYRTPTGVGGSAPCFATGSTSYQTDYAQLSNQFGKGPPNNVSTKYFIVAVDTKLNESPIPTGATCGGTCLTLAPHP